jgi:hypothetical protein
MDSVEFSEVFHFVMRVVLLILLSSHSLVALGYLQGGG